MFWEAKLTCKNIFYLGTDGVLAYAKLALNAGSEEKVQVLKKIKDGSKHLFKTSHYFGTVMRSHYFACTHTFI
jgi:hypothetical protein